MNYKLATATQAQQIQANAEQVLGYSYELLNKNYLPILGESVVHQLIAHAGDVANVATDVRIFQIERIVVENKQSVLESLTAAYTALGTAGYSVFLLLTGDGVETTVYLGVKSKAKQVLGHNAGLLLEKAFKGHFAGSKLNAINGEAVNQLLRQVSPLDRDYSAAVTAVTGVPSLSVEEREHFIQGLEHFLDAAEGRKYQAIILAEPLNAQQLDTVKLGYESVATQLSPLLKQSVSFGENESASVGLSISENLSKSLGESLGLTETKGTNTSESNTVTSGTNNSQTEGTSDGISGKSGLAKIGTLLMAGTGAITGAVLAPASGGTSLGLTAASLGLGAGAMASGTLFDTKTSSTTSSSTVGGSFSESQARTTGYSDSTARSNTQTTTDTYGTTTGKNSNQTIGTSKQITLESINKHVEQLLKRVDQQLERVEEARRYGAWNTAAYFIAEDSASSASLASLFLGLMRGNNSNSEDFALTTWKGENSRKVLPWLANLSHPRLNLDVSKQLNIAYLTPATLVSGKEMAIQLSLPRRSTSTVSVVETQAFGRRIQNVNDVIEAAQRTVDLGVVRHLFQNLTQKVELDLDILASHVFVSGSTGSGKSNTVYQLLNQAMKHDVPFMVIEPAKGEYKHVLGHRDDVLVLGTNPKQAQLLKINPFKFPDGIHVLEHIDRLVEIFNVCWPMYAAMPAVLKDAMLTAYQQAGWDLDTSENYIADDLFPNFIDLLKTLEQVIEHSAFSQEVKSNYIGSLVTRVKSLTNGLNGQIFSSHEIDNTQLFDQNVIIDLSRVGSQETKSLIMGILVMRLSEYRMSYSGMNQPLKHITVLEEAHNILKCTSTEQSSEGANVAGKAVEMLSNAIAEMRTFGEGFIIADQSPTAVDISAIKNTNTKIIMRLPEENDRILAGKASGVKDEQIDELAKLPKGVAIVYQNDWLEPVLCKVHHYQYDEDKRYVFNSQVSQFSQKLFNTHLANFLFYKQLNEQYSFDLGILQQGLALFNMATPYRISLQNAIWCVQQRQLPSIWLDETNRLNLLFSILGMRTEVDRLVKDDLSLSGAFSAIEIEMKKHLQSTPNELLELLKLELQKIWQYKTKAHKHD